MCAIGHYLLSVALLFLSVTTGGWRVVLTRRGVPRLSELVPGVAEPGAEGDDLDAWLDERDVPDGTPFLISPALEYDLDLNRYFLALVMAGAAQNTRLAAGGGGLVPVHAIPG